MQSDGQMLRLHSGMRTLGPSPIITVHFQVDTQVQIPSAVQWGEYLHATPFAVLF